jgi:hypothetical protein
MAECRIIHRTLRHPTGHVANWFEIETIHAGKPHRSSDRVYHAEDEARAVAAVQCDQVDPILYREDR